jgi:hypothetical protein
MSENKAAAGTKCPTLRAAIEKALEGWHIGDGSVDAFNDVVDDIEREVLAHAGVTAEPAEPVETAEMNALREENDKLREALGDSALAATMLHKLSVENGGINAVYSGGAAQLLAEALGQQFTESGAENYLEVGFNTSTGVRLLVTLQRCDGKTPATFRREAEEKLAEAISEIERLRVAAQVPAAEVRAQALEEAAEVTERCYAKSVFSFELGTEAAARIRALKLQSTADKASEVRAAECLKPLADLHDELNRVTWEGGDEGWNLAITAVQKRIAGIIKLGIAAPSTADSANTGALGEGADRG